MKQKIKILQLACIIIIAGLLLTGCKKTQYDLKTTSDVNITGFVNSRLDSFSLFKEILEVTGSASFLDAYGAYTCFVVTDEGVKRWMESVGVSSIASVDVNTLKNLVR